MTLTQIGPTTEYAGNSMKKEELEIRVPLQRADYQYFIRQASGIVNDIATQEMII